MSVLSKIFTAIRGGAREAGESIVDANAVRIFEQEIHDSKNHIKKAKDSLTSVMAEKMQAARKLDATQNDITENEQYVTKALEKGDEVLALAVAEKIASLETHLSEQQHIHDNCAGHIAKLKEQIQTAERQISDNERQLNMIKTTENVHKATSAISNNFASSGSKIVNAKESLDRIKKRQQMREDKLKAAQELNSENFDNSLQDQLKEAGIINDSSSSANSVLERLKAKQ
ncbi:MAG: phage shock protein A [Candidatus Endobugula sp.]|jgi:phage shock protein A